jgi:hypothetical protein
MTTSFEAHIERLRMEALQRIQRVPVAALIWGPAPTATTPVASARGQLKDQLNLNGHHARFSEDLVDPKSTMSVVAQQMSQAEAFDVVFSIPDSPGSIAEIHDFARIPQLSHKIVAYLNADWNSGYANQSLIQLQSVATCKIQLYKAADLPGCILTSALEMVRRLQEYYYLNGRRY